MPIIRKLTTRALADFDMIHEHDRIMVAISGGKDSTILLLILNEIRKKAPINFSLHPVMLDLKQPGFDPHHYKNWLSKKGFDLTIIEEDTYSIVQDKMPKQKTTCGLCSRLRRGILYNYAHKHEYNKIVLGHHRDDINQTLLMNLFYNGSISTMPAKLQSDDKRNIVIRPMAYVPERLILEYEKYLEIPSMPCNLCGSQENLKRQKIKNI